MTISHTVRRWLAPSLATAFSSLLSVPALAQGSYSTESFENHRFAAGALGGTTLWNGQDGWILFDSGAYPGNLDAASVQSALVRSGDQAVRFDASLLTPGAFGELRRNELFSVGSGVLEIELDFLITSSANPSEWEIYSQSYPNPASCYLRWWIATDGRVEFHDTPNRVYVQTNNYVSKDAWHHARSVVDFAANRFDIFIDGVLVGSGEPIAQQFLAADHGFTQVDCYAAGDDSFYFDNFSVRARAAEHGLSVDLPRLPAGRRAVVDLRLAGGSALANRPYAVLGSLSGTTPGTPIGAVTLPLNADGFFGIIVNALGTAALPGFLGTLNADGNAYATFDTNIDIPPALVGLELDFAYITLDPYDAVSEPVRAVVVQ